MSETLFWVVLKLFSRDLISRRHLQSSRQCRKNLIWSTSARSSSNTWWISLWYSRSSCIWNIKFFSSTYVPVGLNIHMFSACVRCWRWAGSFGESSGEEPPGTLTRPLKIPPSLHLTTDAWTKREGSSWWGDIIVKLMWLWRHGKIPVCSSWKATPRPV